MINIKIKKIKNDAVIPTKSTVHAACFDLYACLDNESVEIQPQTNVKIGTGLSFELPNGYMSLIFARTNIKIGTGLSFELPHGYMSLIFARSGIATKESLRPANCVGVIDSDYRGEYIVPLFNDSNEIKTVKNNERIAQLVILPYPEISFNEVDELSTTSRGENGFGSSGK